MLGLGNVQNAVQNEKHYGYEKHINRTAKNLKEVLFLSLQACVATGVVKIEASMG